MFDNAKIPPSGALSLGELYSAGMIGQVDKSVGTSDGVDNGPLRKQEGGDHYKSWAIQPVEFLQTNADRLDWCQANAIKYICRFRDKGGLVDLRKAQHYLELLIDFEYNRNKNSNTRSMDTKGTI